MAVVFTVGLPPLKNVTSTRHNTLSMRTYGELALLGAEDLTCLAASKLGAFVVI